MTFDDGVDMVATAKGCVPLNECGLLVEKDGQRLEYSCDWAGAVKMVGLSVSAACVVFLSMLL